MPLLYKNVLMFKATIPYEFSLEEDNYSFATNSELDINLKKRRRLFTIHRENMFVEDQHVPSTNSYFSKLTFPNLLFSYNISKVEVQIEIFDDEVNSIKDYYSSDSKGREFLSGILQNILLIFAQLYNQTMGGEDFFKPVVDYYGPFISALFENSSEKPCKAITSVSYGIPKIKNERKIVLNELIPTQWRFYFNRAKNSYNLYDNVDAILSGAISLESYVMWLIKIYELKDEVESLKNKNGKISFFQEVKILKKNRIINKEIEKAIIKTFCEFKNYRNEIVHGELDSPFDMREVATKCINSIIQFYNLYEKDWI